MGLTSSINPATPPELICALPRRTRLTANGVVSLVFAIPVLALTLAMSATFGTTSMRGLQTRSALRAGSRIANGEVTQLAFIGRHNTPRVQYTFAVDGTWYTGKVTVPGKWLSAYQQFSQVPIRYLPENPAVNHPADWEESTPTFVWPILSPLMFVTFEIFLFMNLRRQHNLLAEGTPAVGVITACTLYKGSYSMKYDFTTADGQSLKGRSTRKQGQQIGASVSILYMSQKPACSGIYPLDLYRIAE